MIAYTLQPLREIQQKAKDELCHYPTTRARKSKVFLKESTSKADSGPCRRKHPPCMGDSRRGDTEVVKCRATDSLARRNMYFGIA